MQNDELSLKLLVDPDTKIIVCAGGHDEILKRSLKQIAQLIAGDDEIIKEPNIIIISADNVEQMEMLKKHLESKENYTLDDVVNIVNHIEKQPNYNYPRLQEPEAIDFERPKKHLKKFDDYIHVDKPRTVKEKKEKKQTYRNFSRKHKF